MSSAEFESESVRVGRLIERLLVDPVFRAEFRVDPVGVCVGLGLEGLGAELGSGKAMHTLELRESRSSLAGVVMAVAAEGVGVAELRGLVGHGLHGQARAAALKALHGGGLKEPRGLRSGGVGHLERVVERQARGSGLAGSHGSGAVGAGGGSSSSGAAGGAAAGGSGAPAGRLVVLRGCRPGRLGRRLVGLVVRRRRRRVVVLLGRCRRRRVGLGRRRVVVMRRLVVVMRRAVGMWWGLIRLRRRGGRRRRRRVVVGRGLMRLVAVVRVVLVWVVLLVALVGVLVLVLVVVRVGWLGWFRRVLVLVLGVGCWLVLVVGGWRSCWRVRGCRCRRGCGRRFRRVVWIRGWCRCWGVRWRITRSWLGGWSRLLIRCMRSRWTSCRWMVSRLVRGMWRRGIW